MLTVLKFNATLHPSASLRDRIFKLISVPLRLGSGTSDPSNILNFLNKFNDHHIFFYLCLRIRGALNIQAEIKPIEPVRVMPEREIEISFQSISV